MTPVDWCSKLQSAVETATFGSEHVAACTATEQTLDLRPTLRHLGVPIDGPSFMLGDDESVVNMASVPHSKLHKRHNALSSHCTREAVAAGITRLLAPLTLPMSSANTGDICLFGKHCTNSLGLAR